MKAYQSTMTRLGSRLGATRQSTRVLVTIAGSGGNPGMALAKVAKWQLTQITGGPFRQPTSTTPAFRGMGLAYAHGDSGTGLWRSHDAGINWTMIHTCQCRIRNLGFGASRPTNPAYV